MKSLIGYLVEARIPGLLHDVWVRLSLEAMRGRANRVAANPESQYTNILETRVTPYYRVSALEARETTQVIVPARQQAKAANVELRQFDLLA